MLILILGTSAAGKSTLAQTLAARRGWRYVYASAAKLELVRPGEQLHLFDQRRTLEINQEFFDGLGDDGIPLLVDTHATYPVGDGFVRLTPPSVASRTAGIVFLEAAAETIRARRLERGRSLEPTDLPSVRAELRAERAEVERLVRECRIPICGLDAGALGPDALASSAGDFLDGLAPV